MLTTDKGKNFYAPLLTIKRLFVNLTVFLTAVLDTLVRNCPNKFGKSLTYS